MIAQLAGGRGTQVRGKITKRSVDALKPAAAPVFLWDTEVPGFGCKITPTGKRIYVLQYNLGRHSRRYTIGLHGADVTAEQARDEAILLRGQLRADHDPAAERKTRRAVPFFSEFGEQYLRDHAEQKKKQQSIDADRRNLTNHLVPAFAALRINEIAQADVARFHAGMSAKPGAANRCLALLSKMMNLAEAWGMRASGSNPTRHGERYPERKMQRFLSEAELARLGACLAEIAAADDSDADRTAIRALRAAGVNYAEARVLRWDQVDLGRRRLDLVNEAGEPLAINLPAEALRALRALEHGGRLFVLPPRREAAEVIAAVRLLVLTGCRRNEILTLRWPYVDLQRGVIHLPDSKTGPKLVPLGAPARLLLNELPRLNSNDHVLPGRIRGGHFVGLEKAWQRIRRRAGLPGLRLHDLRHSFAAVGAGMSESLLIIGSLLGHAEPGTTARYAHLSNDPQRAAADRIAGRIDALMAGRSAEVVTIRPKV
jgi:integrase